jgi:hypothetical protein
MREIKKFIDHRNVFLNEIQQFAVMLMKFVWMELILLPGTGYSYS